MRISARGFTLVELLVVITIMGLVGAYVLSNYNTFGEDKKLKNAALDVQSLLRQAQTSATSNTKCDSDAAESWEVAYTGTKTLALRCRISGVNAPTVKKIVTLPANTEIQTITGNHSSCIIAPPFETSGGGGGPMAITINPATSFTPLSGQVNLGGSDCTLLTITLLNSKTGSSKSLKIETGGRIYE